MKNIIKLCAVVAIALCTVMTVEAKSDNSKKQITKSVFVTDIDCESCTKKIMNVLPYQKGIKKVDVDLSHKSVTVEYDAAKSSDETIKASLRKLDIKVMEGKDAVIDHTGHNHAH